MQEAFQVSVRALVAFQWFCPDILPASQLGDLAAGAQAHRARQGRQKGTAELPIKWTYCVMGARITLHGRMDAFTPGEVPLVEEIKLSSRPPDEPLPEHRAQAVCYAAMTALRQPCPSVRVRICYVDIQGGVLAAFEEEASAQSLAREMDALLRPYAAYALRERAHARQRDESIRALGFPFDNYRKGQREMAVQVYTAIMRKRRLFASMPTGTGKSAAVLFPALKAMAEGATGKLLYLTARNTARQSPLAALALMQSQGLKARVSVLSAKERLCPAPMRCHPDDCERARGHYLRQGAAIEELLAAGALWTDEVIREAADRHCVCPFELALALTELSDVTLMDLNYAFDPFVQVKRLFQQRRDLTLLVDEAHHALERVRECLSAELSSRENARLRTLMGKRYGRTHPLYRSLTALTRALRALPPSPSRLDAMPEGLAKLAQDALSQTLGLLREGGYFPELMEALRSYLRFVHASENLGEDVALILEAAGRERTLRLCCLLPGAEIRQVTKPLCGAVFFSATLSPLSAMKQLLGGEEEDACLSLPSPYSPQHLAVVRRRVSTRYAQRQASAQSVADAIAQAVEARSGKYIAYFPSYAYLELVRERLQVSVPLLVQRRDMDEASRQAFLDAFSLGEGPRLGLCVLGGLFSEGIDLPGDRLVGAIIVGVGLPVPSPRLEAIQSCYERHYGDGFGLAYRIPAMHKVLQAAGRVIRSEEDRGLVLLLDDRYYAPEYAALLPAEWIVKDEDVLGALKELEES